MEFTELYKQSSNLCRFSPNNAYLATAVQYRLVIRDSETLQILHLFSCIDNISEVQWSPDSEYIICASFKLGNIQVFSLRNHEWTAKIDEGLAGLTAVKWTPDGRHVMAFSDFQLRITIWSLLSRDAYFIQYPKYSDRGISFRQDGLYMAVAERKDCKDFVSIYDCEDWSLVKYFPVDTADLEDIAWSPDGRFIAVWENNLTYKLLVYYPDGRLLSSYSAYEYGLGIKSVKWSPSSQLLAVGSYDQKVRLLNYYTWKPLMEFSFPSTIDLPDVPIFKEHDLRDSITAKGNLKNWDDLALTAKLQYELHEGPFTIHGTRPDATKPNPKLGIGMLEFDCSGRLLCVRNDNMPCTLWIFDLLNLRQVALINNLQPIRQIKWNSVIPGRLGFISTPGFSPPGGNENVTGWIYLWDAKLAGEDPNTKTLDGGVCEVVEVPAVNFQVSSFNWSPDGKALALMDKDKFCLSFIVE